MDINKIRNKFRTEQKEKQESNPVECVRVGVVIQWLNSKNNTIKMCIKDFIDKKYFDYYNPKGRYLTKIFNGEKLGGVWYSSDKNINDRMEINFFNTHYTSITIMFNYINASLLKRYQDTGEEYLIYDGIQFSCKNPIKFNDDWGDNYDETHRKVKLQLKLSELYFDEIYIPGSDVHNEILEALNKSKKLGDKHEDFYIEKIYDFFDDLIYVDKVSGSGSSKDLQGIDVITTHKNNLQKKHQVKGSFVYDVLGGYNIRSSFSHDSPCDYYVFVVDEERILVFNFIKNLVQGLPDGKTFFPNELLVKDIRY